MGTTTMAPATTLAPLAAPPPPKPKVAMGLSIAANFSELGLNDENKKAEFSRDFENTMKAKLGGNTVIVTGVTAGSVKVDFEVEATGSDPSAVAALKSSTSDLKEDLSSGGVALS